MNEILLCDQSLSAQLLQSQCGININQISTFGCKKPTMAVANTPYLINQSSNGSGQSVLSQLSPVPVATELTKLSLSYGGDNVIALADVTAKLKEYNVGLMGASTSLYANRVKGFAGAVKDYQGALMKYREAVTSKSPLQGNAKQEARAAFNKMQSQFRYELNTVTGQVKARRGIPLTNVDRATNIAKSSRNIAKLHVSDQVSAGKLVKFTKHAKLLGNGLAAIDFGSRAADVHHSYQTGGDWERDLFIESTSFAMSAIAGTVSVNVGSAALLFFMVATPIGWLGLVVGGLAVVGAATGVSMSTNAFFKKNSGGYYDSIMKWTSAL